MTVISTLITRTGTVHATDSLLTFLRDGQSEPLEWQQTKIVPVRPWRGAMSFWGLAKINDSWSTLEWLRNQATSAGLFRSPEAFAHELAVSLQNDLSQLRFQRITDAGIGIHFSAYERIADRWIPELFLISNWGDTSYTSLRATGVGVSRETYSTVSGQGGNPATTNDEERLKVSAALQAGTWFRYNNGDPRLYNTAANAFHDMIIELVRRGVLRNIDDINTIRSLATRPVEIVSAIQRDFCVPGRRVVGGRIHDLAVTPTGAYSSASGDDT
jgi:hypothetical protein